MTINIKNNSVIVVACVMSAIAGAAINTKKPAGIVLGIALWLISYGLMVSLTQLEEK